MDIDLGLFTTPVGANTPGASSKEFESCIRAASFVNPTKLCFDCWNANVQARRARILTNLKNIAKRSLDLFCFSYTFSVSQRLANPAVEKSGHFQRIS